MIKKLLVIFLLSQISAQAANEFVPKQLTELWVRQLNGSIDTRQSLSPINLVGFGNKIYFSGSTAPSGYGSRYEPCITDLNGIESAGILKTIYSGNSAGSEPKYFTQVGSTIYFAAMDGTYGRELWKTNGTEAGTVMVKNIRPGPNSSSPYGLRSFKGKLIFVANDGVNGEELWISDGTDAGTYLLKDIRPGSGSSAISNMVEWNNILYFSAGDSVNNRELWRSDGTSAGTYMLKDINYLNSDPYGFTPYKGHLYFQAYQSGESGAQLWRTDGTANGTVRVKSIPSNSAYGIHSLTVANDLLFFVSPASSYQVWRSDGTANGTYGVMKGNNAHDLVAYKNALYFVGDDGLRGLQIWRTTGTEASTALVHEIYNAVGSSPPRPSRLRVLRGILLFAQTRDGYGREWWQTDGTQAGLKIVADLNPGPASSLADYNSPNPYANEDIITADTLVFSAVTAQSGGELWALTGGPPLPHEFRVLGLTVAPAANNTKNVSIRFTSQSGRKYRIEKSPTLRNGAWAAVTTVTATGLETTTNFQHTQAGPAGFWRVVQIE